jgi:hypothetical protein
MEEADVTVFEIIKLVLPVILSQPLTDPPASVPTIRIPERELPYHLPPLTLPKPLPSPVGPIIVPE